MIERIDFPKKYPVPSWIILIVVLLVFVGVSIHNCSQKQLQNETVISQVEITEYSRVHIEVQYTVQNLSRFDREPNLMLKVYDVKGLLLASALFNVRIPAGKTQSHIKIIDKLIRPLDIDEKPGKAVLTVFPRKVI